MTKRMISLLLLAVLAASCLCVPAMASSGPMDEARSAEVKNGLVTGDDGRVYCYADGRMLTGIQTVGGKTYYFSAKDGHRMAGGFVTDGKQRYYASAKDGHLMKNGFVTVKGERYYLAPDGHVMKGGFISDGGQRYYLDKADGHVHSGEFVTVGSRRYFLSPEDGHCLTGCVMEDRGQLYYLAASDGHVMCGGWISAASGRYYAGADGALYTGVRDVGGQTYYFDPDAAWLRRGVVLSFGGKLHYFDETDGHMVRGSWVQDKAGRRYYAGADGALVTGRASVDGATYIFDERDGHLIEGPIERLPLENQDLVHRLSQESRGSCLATSFSMAANLILGWDKYGAFDWCAPGSDAANVSQYNTFEARTAASTGRPSGATATTPW